MQQGQQKVSFWEFRALDILCLSESLETGMRAGEIWGFKTSDIPRSGNKSKISRQLIGPNEFTPTKGKRARFVPFNDNLATEVKSLPRGQVIPFSDALLFTTKKGRAISHDYFVSSTFRKDIRESGVSLIRFHDLRHTALTMFVKRGIALPVIQAIAGHKAIRT